MNREFLEAIQLRMSELLKDHVESRSPDTIYSWSEIVVFMDDLKVIMTEFYNTPHDVDKPVGERRLSDRTQSAVNMLLQAKDKLWIDRIKRALPKEKLGIQEYDYMDNGETYSSPSCKECGGYDECDCSGFNECREEFIQNLKEEGIDLT